MTVSLPNASIYKRGKMAIHATEFANSEQKILAALQKNHGPMTLATLFKAMRDAGLGDENLIRSGIWSLIAQARIERDADTVSLRRP